MKKLGADPLRDFGFSVDTALRPIRANIIAMNEMANHSDLEEPEVGESLGFLIADVYARLDSLLQAHEAALAASRGEVAA